MTVTNAEDNSTAHTPSGHSAFPGPRAKALARLAQKCWDAATPHADEVPEEWSVCPISPALSNRKVELLVAPEARALEGAFQADIQGVVVDLDAVRYAQASAYQSAFEAIAPWMQQSPRQTIWLRLRAPVDGAFELALEDAANFLALCAEPARANNSLIGIELPGLRCAFDAQRWERVLAELERALGLPAASVPVTLRLDTNSAIQAIDAALYPLRERVSALRMSLAPLLSDMIRQGAAADDSWQPARQDALTLEYPLADALAKHFTVAAHRRGALALSGMLPALPVRDDDTAQQEIMAETADLTRQRLRNGYDGVLFAHSALAAAVGAVFADMMPTDNQLERPLDWAIHSTDLQPKGQGPVSDAGMRNNIGVAIQGIEAALQHRSRFALYNQIEDAASTALCWQQLWQWVHTADATLDDGRPLDAELVRTAIAEELEIIRLEREHRPTENDRSAEAAELLLKICLAPELPVFPPANPTSG